MGLVSKIIERLRPEPKWPTGQALVDAAGFRYGTLLSDGSIAGAPGVRFERLPKQQTVKAEGEEQQTERAQCHAKDRGAPRIAGDLEAITDTALDRVIDPLSNTEKQQG